MRLGQLVKETRGDHWLIPRYFKYAKKRKPEEEAKHAAAILGRKERDRSQGWSSSSAGGCIRAQLYTARKAPKAPVEDKSMGYFMNGHFMHLRHQVAGLSAGYLTEVEVPVVIEELNVRGTMDGITSEGIIAEFKSINPYGYRKVAQFGPKPEHVRQVNAYMRASDIKSARLLYEDKGTNEMSEFLLNFDPKIDALNVKDWEELNTHMEEGTRPKMLPECQQEEGRYKWCPFAEECMKDHRQERKSRIRLTSSSDGD